MKFWSQSSAAVLTVLQVPSLYELLSRAGCCDSSPVPTWRGPAASRTSPSPTPGCSSACKQNRVGSVQHKTPGRDRTGSVPLDQDGGWRWGYLPPTRGRQADIQLFFNVSDILVEKNFLQIISPFMIKVVKLSAQQKLIKSQILEEKNISLTKIKTLIKRTKLMSF